jgi:hypothetical protein
VDEVRKLQRQWAEPHMTMSTAFIDFAFAARCFCRSAIARGAYHASFHYTDAYLSVDPTGREFSDSLLLIIVRSCSSILRSM